MPRITRVKKSRVDQGTCGRCRTPLPAGSAYQWIKFRNMPKRKRCMSNECRFRSSDMTTSDKISNFWVAIEDVEDKVAECQLHMPDVDTEGWAAWLGELAEVIEASADNIEQDVAEGYNESASNMEDYFSGSSQVDELYDKGTHYEEQADELRQLGEDVADMATNDPNGQSWQDIENALERISDGLCSLYAY